MPLKFGWEEALRDLNRGTIIAESDTITYNDILETESIKH